MMPQEASASSADSGPKTLLVAYASRTGTTAEVAQEIGRDLRTQGLRVDVLPAAKVDRIDGYNAVVVGSAVRYGTWLDEALAFLRRHRAELALRPVAFFTLHMQQGGTSEQGRAARAAYSAAARALVTPRDEAFFLGALLPERLSFLDRMAVRMVGAPLEDRRDWAQIAAWTKGLPGRLLPGRPLD